ELAHVAARAFEPRGLIARRRAGGFNLQESLKLSDPVVDMNNVVPDFEIAEVRQKRGGCSLLAGLPRDGALRRRAFDFAEDIGFGEQRQIRGRKREPVRELANGYRPAMTSLGNLTFSRSERGQQFRGDLILAEHLGHTFSESEARHHEQRRLRCRFQIAREIGNSPVIAPRRLRDDRYIGRALCNRKEKKWRMLPACVTRHRSSVSRLRSPVPRLPSPVSRPPSSVPGQARGELLIRSRGVPAKQSKLDPGRGIEPRSQLFDSEKEFVGLQREFSSVV